MLKPLALAPIAAALLALAAACSGGNPVVPTPEPPTSIPSDSRTAEPVATTPEPQAPTPKASVTSGNDSPFRKLLTLFPETPETRGGVYLIDYDLMHRYLGREMPGPEASPDDLRFHRDRLDFASKEWTPGWLDSFWVPFITGYDRSAKAEMGDWVGFDLRDVRASASAGPRTDRLFAMIGSFVPTDVETALNECVATVRGCFPHENQSHQGVAYYSWLVDDDPKLINIAKPPALDIRGRMFRTSVAETHIFQGATTLGIESLIDTSLGTHASLADREDFRLLADAVTELGAAITVFSDRTNSVGWFMDQVANELSPGLEFDDIESLFSEFGIPEEFLGALEELVGSEPLLPFTAFATGIGVDDDGRYMALALVHESPELASDNVDVLPRRVAAIVKMDGKTP
jgi:hypothetical protein